MGAQPATMRSPTLQGSDLSARARIREAALALFASEGFGVSLRTIADAAGVSPALVVHHFATKEGLKDAVDRSVLALFLDRFELIPKGLPADRLAREMADVLSGIIGTSPVIRRYVRRSLLEETPAGTTIVDQLVSATERGLALLGRAGGLRSVRDPQWRPFQVLSVILGPLLFEAVMQRHVRGPVYSPDAVRRRTDANLDLLARGLFRDVPAPTGEGAPPSSLTAAPRSS